MLGENAKDAKQTVRVFDGFYRKQGRKTKQATFRVYEEDFVKLKADYPENMGLVIRILLEQFLAGKLPDIETKVKQQLMPQDLRE